MKKLLLRIKLWILSVWQKTDTLIEKIAPIAINVVEQVKTVNESTTGDVIELIISNVIKGDADDVFIRALRDRLRKTLPIVLERMRLIVSIAKTEGMNEQAKAILNAINMSDDEMKSIYYHTFCSLVIEKLSDGECSWGDSVILSEYYFKNIYKNGK